MAEAKSFRPTFRQRTLSRKRLRRFVAPGWELIKTVSGEGVMVRVLGRAGAGPNAPGNPAADRAGRRRAQPDQPPFWLPLPNSVLESAGHMHRDRTSFA
jgi:hypothetical protein